ncbi:MULTISPECIES: hypothetical protein [Aphanizomenonaceae]|uniref:hypothetical protein n=1 Tax=Aphanizomenonaceae TaxID=1892259 RepID=UPI0005521FA7|nr:MULTISPECIES: hypothetical protein [Aphanizomenonaceae]MBE9256539.1 hypothetical protein [Dolichospermum sp. LEGE 00246]MDK2408468.1 hypothetical protein [Aphanizomenon sp. 202]MDK2459409.1 hypothetical protein [Aphanizomenon sp. PH219]
MKCVKHCKITWGYSRKIDAGVKFAIANAIERHRRLGESISILRDGKVVTLTADEIPPRNVNINFPN